MTKKKVEPPDISTEKENLEEGIDELHERNHQGFLLRLFYSRDSKIEGFIVTLLPCSGVCILSIGYPGYLARGKIQTIYFLRNIN